MQITAKNELGLEDKAQIMQIWNAVYPDFMAFNEKDDLNKYLASLSSKSHWALYEDDGKLSGWLCTFTRDNARWFVMIIDPRNQGKGCGRRLMDYASLVENHLFGWVVDHDNYRLKDGRAYKSPIYFYERLGFQINSNVTFDNGTLQAIQVEWRRDRL